MRSNQSHGTTVGTIDFGLGLARVGMESNIVVGGWPPSKLPSIGRKGSRVHDDLNAALADRYAVERELSRGGVDLSPDRSSTADIDLQRFGYPRP